MNITEKPRACPYTSEFGITYWIVYKPYGNQEKKIPKTIVAMDRSLDAAVKKFYERWNNRLVNIK